ncbi:LIC12162 family transferase [Gemmatimonadota bacterium]
MHLVTTGWRESWPQNGKVLFLGHWCLKWGDRDEWSGRKNEVLAYHWDDRARLHRDFHYLTGVYEAYLAKISAALNRVHGTSFSSRYWRIVVGPWLRYFIDILYDRFLSIQGVVEDGRATRTTISREDLTDWVPVDFGSFGRLWGSDGWNHVIYGWLIRLLEAVPYDVQDIPSVPGPNIRLDRIEGPIKRSVKLLAAAARRIVPPSARKVALVASYFSPRDLARILLPLGQAPMPWYPRVGVPDLPLNGRLRASLDLELVRNGFEEVLSRAIPLQMPKAYLEAFHSLRASALDAFPRGAEVIHTANAYSSDEGFKVWAGESVERGAKLLISQHGGMYGMGLWEQTEDHQVKVSDRFYSWGWDRTDTVNVRQLPSGNLIRSTRLLKWTPRGKILWIFNTYPRYSYRMYSVPVAGQFRHYLADQMEFGRALTPETRRILRIRLYPKPDVDWDIRGRLVDGGFGDLIDPPLPFEEHVAQARLCVVTYNATTLLETLAADIPTIVFWNPTFWELRPEAQAWFDRLRGVGIMHDTPSSAAAKVEEVRDDPRSWWSDPTVEEVHRGFCEKYANVPDDWSMRWRAELRCLASR